MAGKQLFFHDSLLTPIGKLQIASDEESRLTAVLWDDSGESVHRLLSKRYGDGFRMLETRDAGGFTSALRDYLAGNLDAIAGLPVAAFGTSFQQTIWNQLRHIPAGVTISYGELARRAGNPKAARAAGLANGSNPVSIVVPCHRVIGSTNALTGYAGGLERKAWLLRHEGYLLL